MLIYKEIPGRRGSIHKYTNHMVFGAPYPDNRISASRVQPVQCRVILETVHTRSVLSFNFITNHI